MFGRRSYSSRSQELVFLDPDDDLSTVRSKLESSSAEEVYLVVPRKAPLLRTPLEFRMLARIANELPSETVLVVGDSLRRRLAQNEGFRTRRSLRTLKHLMLRPDQNPPMFVVPDWAPSIGSLVSFVVLMGVVALVALVALPEMQVTLVPQSTDVTRDVDVTVVAGAQTNVERGILAGEQIRQQLQVAGSFPIPSERTVGQERARGEAVLVSQRPQPITFPKGSIVAVPDGPKFTTDQDLRLLPGVPGRVGITAREAGTGGNVGPGQITALEGADVEGLQVTNQRPTTGGTDRQARVVTEEDQAGLRKQLADKARNDGYFQLKQRATSDRSVPEASLQVKVDDVKFDQQPGGEAEQLTGRLTATATAIAFNNLAFNDLVTQLLAGAGGRNVKVSGQPSISPPGVLSTSEQEVKLRTHASGTVVSDVDAGEIERSLRGKTGDEAREAVRRVSGLAQAPRVQISPSWAPRAWRVHVVVQGGK